MTFVEWERNKDKAAKYWNRSIGWVMKVLRINCLWHKYVVSKERIFWLYTFSAAHKTKGWQNLPMILL